MDEGIPNYIKLEPNLILGVYKVVGKVSIRFPGNVRCLFRYEIDLKISNKLCMKYTSNTIRNGSL
jgi:hypothetical protein